jgi:hypothetical protein
MVGILGKRLGNHHVSICMHQRKLWFLCVDVSLRSRMCVIVRYAHLAQPGEQCKSVCLQNEELFCLCFLILSLSVYACECWDLRRTPDTKRRRKRKNRAGQINVDGLNCLKTALLSEISHCSTFSNLCLFRY